MITWVWIAAVVLLVQAQPQEHYKPSISSKSQPSSGVKSDCVGNVMRLTVEKALAGGNQLQVEAINGSQYIHLTPILAAQCGYSMESDPWGNIRIYASLMGCYVNRQEDDMTFDVGLRLKIYNKTSSDVVTHEIAQTCEDSRWRPEEVLCDRNYMEVSNYVPNIRVDEEGQEVQNMKLHDDSLQKTVTRITNADHGIWKLAFHAPEPSVMLLKEAQEAGFGAMTTSDRLILRSSYNTQRTYIDTVAGVPMEIFKVRTYYKLPHDIIVINSAAACPVGGVLLTEKTIAWHVPRLITPLANGRIKIFEMHMGINGQRLSKSQMAARRYTLSATENHIVTEIPIGSPDGYYKSHAPDYQYHITYTVEPMLELLWWSEDTQADTKYKVLFPITTPSVPWPLHFTDNTIPEERVFSITLGTFLHDVELLNITFSTAVLTVDECNARGFQVQEHSHSNGSKTFSLRVPFSDDVVLKRNPESLTTVYTLSLTYGLVIQPEQTPFSYTLAVEQSLLDVVLPSITGTCDQDMFYITVKYGSRGHNIQVTLGSRELTLEQAEIYKRTENGTHFSLVVPYNSTDVAFELIEISSVKARADLLLWDPDNDWKLADFSLACSFPLTITECHANGTVTVLAVKVESAHTLIPSWLTLKDPSCKPVFSDDRFAYFSFTLDSCGTSRTFFDHYVMYENAIGFDEKNMQRSSKDQTSPPVPFRQMIACFYVIHDIKTMEFRYRPRDAEPTAVPALGQLSVQMRLAQDSSYGSFYYEQDYPVEKFLRESLYFEVELESSEPQLELILENCWATQHENRTSLPSWDIIVDGCANLDDSYVTVFQPVTSHTNAASPGHVKRFSMKMFTFTKNNVLEDQIYVHCDAVICESNNQVDGICSGQCRSPAKTKKTQHINKSQRRKRSAHHQTEQISSGPIRWTNSLLKTSMESS